MGGVNGARLGRGDRTSPHWSKPSARLSPGSVKPDEKWPARPERVGAPRVVEPDDAVAEPEAPERELARGLGRVDLEERAAVLDGALRYRARPQAPRTIRAA